MTFRQQIFNAIRNNSVEQLQYVLEHTTAENSVEAMLGLRKACEAKNVKCAKLLLPYAAEFFNRPNISPDLECGKSMSLHPGEILYQLIHDTVVSSNSVPMFELFKDVLISERHLHQCPIILLQCLKLNHMDLIDCLLPFVDDLSILAGYKPHAYAFFEERKALYQNQRLSLAVGDTSVSSIGRKI